ncbi:MAG: A24 family peptidase [Candidatus Woesearchaeota archaeon]
MIAIIAILALAIASYTDLKTREVPDWLSFSLIAAASGLRIIISIISWDLTPIIDGFFGALLGIILAYMMFYSGQWGGGDSKMLIGLGALIGLQFRATSTLVGFLVNLLFIGASYGLLWSIGLAIKNRKEFKKQAKNYTDSSFFKRMRIVTVITVAMCMFGALFSADRIVRLILIVFAGFLFIMLYLWMFVKVVEGACMLKWIEPNKLTEGDWIAKPVFSKNKYLCGPKDLGITKKQIAELQKNKKIKKVLIKEGIPFVPSFLLAYIFTIWLGNIALLMLGA